MSKYHSRVAGFALASVSVIALNSAANAQTYNWTGFYIGVNAGGAWGRSDVSTTTSCLPAGTTFGYYCGVGFQLPNAAAVASVGTGTGSGSGFTGGGQIGYNWQVGSYVYGIETDFGAFNINASRQAGAIYPAAGFPITAGSAFTVRSSVNTDWLFTARGRLGWTFSNVLIYGTGGLALTKMDFSSSFVDNNAFGGFPGAVGSPASASATKVGWTLGGGAEWALGKNWSVKAEYLYVDFGSLGTNSTITHLGFLGYSNAISSSADLTAHIARAGINYKF